MLLYSIFRFHRYGPHLSDFPRLSQSLNSIVSSPTVSAAVAAAAAVVAPPPPGPLLLSRSSLSTLSPPAAAALAAPAGEDKKSFYLTTAIAYANGSPHMGHAYEYLLADTIARLARVLGFTVRFVTGTDEHGLKIAAAAAKEGLSPQELVDQNAAKFECLYTRLNGSHDYFVKTSADSHKRVCQWLWEKCSSQGDIYLGTYTGWYNQREEAFVSESDAKASNYTDPVSGKPLEKMQEESYFFRMGRYHPNPKP